jgi:hypothetical protein
VFVFKTNLIDTLKELPAIPTPKGVLLAYVVLSLIPLMSSA